MFEEIDCENRKPTQVEVRLLVFRGYYVIEPTSSTPMVFRLEGK